MALVDALNAARRRGQIKKDPLAVRIASVSVGICDGQALLDLDYAEDSSAATDMNVVMNDAGGFIEIQGTAETEPFDNKQFQKMLHLANSGIAEILALQKKALKENS